MKPTTLLTTATLALSLSASTAHADLFNLYTGARVATGDRKATEFQPGVEAGVKLPLGVSVGLWVGKTGVGENAFLLEGRQGLIPLPFVSFYLTAGLGSVLEQGNEGVIRYRGGLGVSAEISKLYGGFEGAFTQNGGEAALRIGLRW